jgi:GT2 family glycosyltransferase
LNDFTILIPERGRPDLLAGTLAALQRALDSVDGHPPVHVLVNGAPAADYAALRSTWPDWHWHFHRRALGFHGAIRAGLARIETSWVYLLNSDMRLAPDALQQLLPWCAEDVFAIASQIEFADASRRREETGYTVPVRNAVGELELHDLLPAGECVRAHLYAGGGASIFRTAALQRYLGCSSRYAPFYFEDADWAMQAWADGLRVLYCPASRAVHEHRGTIGRYYSTDQVDAIVARNLAHFRWRYGDLFGAPRWCGGRGDRLAAVARALVGEHRRARASVLARLSAESLGDQLRQRYPNPQRFRPQRPRVLLLSPFAPLPPAHGGARRIVELARASADRVDWVLLHDECERDSGAPTADDPCFREIHPVGGRPPHGAEDRWEAHAHARLLRALQRLLEQQSFDVICFEQVECLGLVEQLSTTARLIWSLHDAGRLLSAADQSRVQRAIDRVDALVLSTSADLGYWRHPRQRLIDNGVRLPVVPVSPSPDDGFLLLVAPLRYLPNLIGLRSFLAELWRPLRRRWPTLRLQVLGGPGAMEYWGCEPMPAGVTLVDQHVDPTASYTQALLALNPQTGTEGSALKVAEALAHGRIMLSTIEGARGYESLDCPALIRVADVAAMLPAITRLLEDPPTRHAAERTAAEAIAPWCWKPRADRLVALINELAVR